ncbi:MAG: cyclic nucleotide-binding domain-containing protein [Nitrospinae bacterium]|nr:cyclic nucleotide-binding domain-containing protein [Nitrospinota bacterium]
MDKNRIQIQENFEKYCRWSYWDKAIIELKKLIELEPKNLKLRLKLGDLYVKEGAIETAIDEYIYVSTVLANNGFLTKAIAINKTIVSLDPSKEGIYKELSELYTKYGLNDEKRTKEQIEDLRRDLSEFYSKHGLGISVKDRSLLRIDKEKVRSSFPIFFSLTPSEFSEMIKKMILHKFPNGSIIIKEGEYTNSFYVISSGRVKVVINDTNNQEIVLATLKEDDFFGEIAFLTGRPRIASVMTVEDSEILELKRTDLERYSDKYPMIKDIINHYCEIRLNEIAKKMKAAGIQRRLSPRLFISMDAKFSLPNGNGNYDLSKSIHSIVQDISLDGVRLTTDTQQLLKDSDKIKGSNAKVEINLPYNMGIVNALGIVQWYSKPQWKFDKHCEIGLSFKEGAVTKEQFNGLISNKYNLSFNKLEGLLIDKSTKKILSTLMERDYSKEYSVVPISLSNNKVMIAISNPIYMLEEAPHLQEGLPNYKLTYCISSEEDIHRIKDIIYKDEYKGDEIKGSPYVQDLHVNINEFYSTQISEPKNEISKVERLFENYIKARDICNESNERMEDHLFFQFVAENTARIRKKIGCESVKYSIIIEDNHTKVLAIV